MLIARIKITALVMAAIGASMICVRADDKPTGELSNAEFTLLAKQLHLKNQPWATIRWKVSLTEARQLAAKEHKPIFLVVNTGNCLGWT